MPAACLSPSSRPSRRGRPPDPVNAAIPPQRIATARLAAKAAKTRLGTWEQVAQWYGACSKASYYRLVEDPGFRPSLRLIEAIEARPLPPAQRLAQPCPTCGRVHGEGLDCGGQAVAAVVILRPGEAIAPAQPAKPRPRHSRGVGTTPATPDQNQRRQALGATWRAVYEAGLAVLEKEQHDPVP